MKKRFTSTTKWIDPWFWHLKPMHKMLWIFVCDSCDDAGVWEPNSQLAEVATGFKFNWAEAQIVLDAKIRVLKNGRWWIPSFIPFQYGNRLSKNAGVHQAIITLLKKHGLLEEYEKWLVEDSLGAGKSSLTDTQPLALDFQPPKPRLSFKPPTLDEVTAYAKERNSLVNPKAFWEYFQNGNPPWTDSKGHLVRAWKQKFITWDSRDSGHSTPPGRKPPPDFPMPRLSN